MYTSIIKQLGCKQSRSEGFGVKRAVLDKLAESEYPAEKIALEPLGLKSDGVAF